VQADLKVEFVHQYLANDGLCRFENEEFRTLDGFTSVRNDNGILNAAVGYLAFDRDAADAMRAYYAVKRLEIEPGRYRRRFDDNVTPEAHDNYKAIAFLSVLFDFTFARDICELGVRVGWQFNNLDARYSWKQLRQGGDIAFYKICAGWIPYPIEMLWLLGSLIYTPLRGWKSTWKLCELTLAALDIAIPRYSEHAAALWKPVAWSYYLTRAIARPLLERRRATLNDYFGPGHVVTRRLAA
jgi:hypothetical protein